VRCGNGQKEKRSWRRHVDWPQLAEMFKFGTIHYACHRTPKIDARITKAECIHRAFPDSISKLNRVT
jgi:hypothetical protein